MDQSRSGAAGVLRRAVAALPPYRGPQIEEDLPGAAGPFRRMSLNESPDPPSPKVIAAVQAAVAGANRYPDPQARALAAAISDRTGVPVSRIVFGNGSHELIMLSGPAFMEAGTRIVVPNPSFQPYQSAAKIAGAEVVAVPVDADGANDVDAMLAACAPAPRMVIAATPNNPTGALLTQSALDRLIAGVPEATLLVIDEAYYEFGRLAGGPDVLRALKTRKGPWLVLRTFSKAYNLAGLRVGYGLASHDEVAEGIQRVRGVFNVNRLAQAAALAALGDEPYAQASQKRTAAERDRLVAGLKAIGLAPLPSAANFVAVRTPKPAAEVVGSLARRGIMIVPVGGPPYDYHIRITVGSAEDTDAVLATLKALL
ncbi:MAG: histidinol-phosphate transaminase [Alphaproteobacteria bacterium]|nr:histidinol-phosphate transaminase [Alphaproteobacteria bacterium]